MLNQFPDLRSNIKNQFSNFIGRYKEIEVNLIQCVKTLLFGF